MSGVNWILTTALASVVGLTACDESATDPADASANPALSVLSETSGPGAAPNIPGPFGPAKILELGDELGLTEDQRSGIQAIAEELRETNQPLWDELRERRADGDGPPAGGPDLQRSFDDPTMQAIRENTREAMDRALALLSEEQVDRFHELRRERLRSLRGERRPPESGFLSP